MMRDYTIGAGFKTVDGHAVAHDIITTIESTATKLGQLESKPGGRGCAVGG